jgi:hypothetical protein
MSRQGFDASNWTELSQYDADFLKAVYDYACLGLQNEVIATDFKRKLAGTEANPMDFEYYVDRPGRSLDLAEPTQWVWIDVEPGCFESKRDVLAEIDRLQLRYLRPLIYANRYSFSQVFGDSTEVADKGVGLVYADYRPPLPGSFQPFNGWAIWDEWQWSGAGLFLPEGQTKKFVNVDLLLEHGVSTKQA